MLNIVANMSSTFYIRILALFCTIFAIAVNNAISKPTRHYGRCMIRGEIGFCQHRQQCWEQGENLSSSNRSSCPSQFRRDLICCRRPPQGITPATLRQLFPQPGTCGIYLDDFKDRIIAGTIAGIKEFPWMALLRETIDGEAYTQLCGGSLIHERWVLTAAHCVPHAKDAQYTFQVRLGEWNTTSSPDCQQLKNEQICAPPHMDINIDRIIVHEEYVEDFTLNPLVTNDIALLRLSQPVQFTEYVLPICLPAANSNDEYAYADYGMDISGWGLTEHIRFGGSPIKLKAVLNTWSMEKCRKIHSQLGSGQLCAGGETLSGTCRGDSGGPLMHPLEYDESTNNKAYFLAGIVSLGSKTCNNNGQPMIFTKVEHYVPWITGTITANT